MKLGIGVLRIAAVVALASSGSVGHAAPELPEVRADQQRIRTTAAECKADADELIEDESGKKASSLCKLRAEHKLARDRLRGALAKLVATYRDFTNHGHARNLPSTLEALQRMVGDCLKAVESQQYCHNIVCATWPEENAILCETKATEIVEAILRPGLGSVSIVPSTP
jgi:hypothetical protein